MFWQWLVIGIWAFWLVIYWRGGLDIIADIRAASSFRDRLYLVLLSFVTICILISALVLTLQRQGAQTLTALGAGLVFLGAVGTFYARGYLGQFWTAENSLQANHRIIDSGPYAYVRHPIYTAAILLYIGTGITFFVWWNVPFVIIAVMVYGLKTVHEDHFLSVSLDGYTDYQKRVPYRLFPKLW